MTPVRLSNFPNNENPAPFRLGFLEFGAHVFQGDTFSAEMEIPTLPNRDDHLSLGLAQIVPQAPECSLGIVPIGLRDILIDFSES